MSLAASRLVTLGVVCGSAGCFVEGTAGVTPKMAQDVVDFSGTTTSTSHVAWTVALWIGFHLEAGPVGLTYSPKVGAYTTYGPASTPEIITSGHYLRLDANVPLTRRFQSRITMAYATVHDATIDATGSMTPTSSPGVLNGKLISNDSSGGTWFAGLSGALHLENGAGMMGSVGLSYLSTTAQGRDDGTMTIPGVSQSGLGIQLRVMLHWQLQTGWFTYAAPAPGEKVNWTKEQEESLSKFKAPDHSETPAPEQKPVDNCTPTTTETTTTGGQFGDRTTESHSCQ